MDVNALKIVLEEQNRRHEKAMEQMLKLVLDGRRPSTTDQGLSDQRVETNTERLFTSFSARMEMFEFLPDEELTFESWIQRYKPVYDEDAMALEEKKEMFTKFRGMKQ